MQLFLLAFNINTPVVKYAILVLAAPLWLPFLKAVWVEFNDILIEEGGLLGREPDERELMRIRRSKAVNAAALVRELRDEKAYTRKRRPDMGARPGFGQPRPGAMRTAAPRARKGFGPPR